MRILVACEKSGVVREAFRRKGHDCWSCDLMPSDIPGAHIQADAILVAYSGEWDMMIAHPPCTYLAVSGLHWNKRTPGRSEKTEEALEFVRKLMFAPIELIAIENPISCISTRIRKPTQIIQPYQFGENASKATCLWLKGLPPLFGTSYFPPRVVNGKNRWDNQTDGGQNRLAPSPTRPDDRAKTYPGIASAMADQWPAESWRACRETPTNANQRRG